MGVQQLEVGGTTWEVVKYRRNYYSCRKGCGRSGTLMLLAKPVSLEKRDWTGKEIGKPSHLLVVCERDAHHRWIPSKGPALRVLGT